MRLSNLDRLCVVQLQYPIDINGASSSMLAVRFQVDLDNIFIAYGQFKRREGRLGLGKKQEYSLRLKALSFT